MRFGRSWLALAVAALALLPAAASGAGYGIYEQGAAVLGMAGAGTASVNDASAMFYNPAAMTGIPGTRLYAGGSLIQVFTSFAGKAPFPGFGVTEEMKPTRAFPGTAYLTHRFEGPWAIGLGYNSPFGLSTEWKNVGQFTGRYIVVRADLRTYNYSIGAARELGKQKKLSIGFGGNLVYCRATLANRHFIAAPGGGGGQLEIAEFGLTSNVTPGYGWNGGLTWTPTKDWKVGLTYRGRVVNHADGDANITQFSTGDPQVDAAVTASLPPDQPASTVLILPSIASLGLAWHWGSAWTFEGDAVHTGWKAFKDLPIYFQNTTSANTRTIENYDNSLAVRVGAERRAAITWRAGYYYDQAAAPTESLSPTIPDADRHGVTAGFGMGLLADKRLTLDVYQLALFLQNRSTDGVNRDGYEGEYKSFVSSTGLSLAYRW
jgi:long-chain fatty acid transport protein